MKTATQWNSDTRSALLTDTCTVRVRTKTGTSGKNKAIYTWADDADQTDIACRGEALEKDDRRFLVDKQDVKADFRMYLNPSVTINEYDRILWDGVEYYVGFAEGFEDLATADYMREVLLAVMKGSS